MEPLPIRVEELANCTSGGQIRFKTNARKLLIHVTLSGPADMSHMTALGQCGFDVYIGKPDQLNYLASAIPPLQETVFERTLWDFTDTSMEERLKEAVVNFPLYQGVEEVWIGTDKEALMEAPTPYISDKRVIFYGTSILQGGCASRPGMSYTNILSRRIPLEFINLGFSGSGKGEQEVALSIRGIERPGCLVIDYEANVTPDEYEATLLPFIQLYREHFPFIPILVVSRINYTRDINPQLAKESKRRRKHAEEVVDQLKKKGDHYIDYTDGSKLLGDDWHECTVDGIHPTDLGFMKMADSLEKPILKSLEMVNNRPK